MAFQTGTYTDVHNFLSLLQTFATTNGYILDKSVAGSGTVTNGELYIHKGTTEYFSLESEILPAASRSFLSVTQSIELPRLYLFGNTGYLGTSNVDAQPGSCNSLITRRPHCQYITSTGPRKYWFFTNATNDYIHAVVNSYPFEYNHICFGTLDKSGVYTGGAYAMASYWDHVSSRNPDDVDHSFLFDARYDSTKDFAGGVVRADVDGRTWHVLLNDNLDPAVALGSARDIGGQALQYSQLKRTMSSYLWNFLVTTRRTGLTRSWLGTPLDLASVAMYNFTAEQEVTLDDSTTWVIFPAQGDNPNNLTTRSYSDPYGYAYRKIV